MANNKEPIAKKCRSLGVSPVVMGYDKKHSNRNPGGNKRKKVSEYGTQLKEKQKVKFVYGVLEKQFHRYYLKASNMRGITGENLLRLLELRLDNVVYRLGLAKTRRMARQIIVHGHIKVNGKKVDIPSYSVKVGDVITLRERSMEQAMFKELRDKAVVTPKWLTYDAATLMGTVAAMPAREDIDCPISEHLIVELYSR
ncbi:MAG: 30S ribosomal protein S4 [Clostridia bacterium]|jgi:small subunit ribosomal protein S4|nr:30S ribosomal protein S4 [Clostridia bacterium]MBO5568722.1 30S ribosomal protein S4 [Clostridia bacterium]